MTYLTQRKKRRNPNLAHKVKYMKIINLLLLFVIMFFIGCSVSNKDGTFRDRDGNILSATETEIEEAQRTLLNAQTHEDLPESAEGGVLLDGKVVSVKVTIAGSYMTLFKIDRILFGDFEGKEIIIHSPSPQKMGINFKEGEIYRVFAVYLEGAYRTWDWLGTVKLDEKISGDQ